MIKKPFFSLGRPQLKYPEDGQNGTRKLSDLSIPTVARLYAPLGNEGSPLLIKEGDEVNTGQRLLLREGEKGYLISTVTGTIRSVEKATGFMDRAVLSITVDVSKVDTIDGEFKAKSDMNTRERVLSYLGAVPGTSSLSELIEALSLIHI